MPITVSYPIHFIGRSWTIFLFADLIFDPFLQLYSFCLLVLTSDSFRLSVYLCIYMCLSMSVCLYIVVKIQPARPEASLMASLEQRLRKEHQTDLQAGNRV